MSRDQKRPARIPGEETYVDFDEETQCVGIFGVESGHCYTLHSDEETAKKALKP